VTREAVKRTRSVTAALRLSKKRSPFDYRAGGIMQLHTYLNYGGNCEDAFKFYEKHLGGKITMLMRHGDQPGGQTPPGWAGKVLHARMNIGETELLGADIPSFQPIRSAYLSLTLDSDREADRVFGLLSDGG